MDDFHPRPIPIGVYTGGRTPVAQSAVKDPNRSQSEITESRLTSMGLAIPPSGRQKLKLAYKACTFWSDFVVVASAKYDIVLGSADDEHVRNADIPSSFPTQVEKKSPRESLPRGVMSRERRLTFDVYVQSRRSSTRKVLTRTKRASRKRGARSRGLSLRR